MQYVCPNIITLHGGTILTNDIVDPSSVHNSPYSETIEYINGYPNTNVTITNRHGVSIVIPPDPPYHGKYNNLFVIRRKIIIDKNVMYPVVHSLSRLEKNGPDTDDTVRSLKKLINENGEPLYVINRFHAHLDTVITLDDLRRASGTLYSEETDLMVSIMGSGYRAVHPHSLEYRRTNRLINNLNEKNPGDLFYKIELIDNYGTYGPRFLKIANEVQLISPRKDHVRRSGVYVTKNTPAMGNNTYTELKETYYPIEEGEKELKLFRTYEQALLSDDDVVSKRKMELGEIEHDTARMKAESSKILAEEKLAPDFLRKITEVIKPMSVILVSIFGGIKVIYSLGKVAGAAGIKK